MSTLTSTEGADRLAATVARATRKLHHQQRGVLLEILEAIADAETWDEEVYGVRPDDDWLLIHRASWGAIRDLLEKVDFWRPWSNEQPPAHYGQGRDR